MACMQTAANMYSVIFYALILPMLSNATQSGKMVARLPLFWMQSHRRRMFPGAHRLLNRCQLRHMNSCRTLCSVLAVVRIDIDSGAAGQVTSQRKMLLCARAGWAYAVALALIGIPVFLFESLLWVLIIYWGAGMEHNAGRCGTHTWLQSSVCKQ